MRKLTSKSITDSFWIVEDGGNKVGTLKQINDIYVLFDKNNNKEIVYENLDDFKVIASNKTTFVNQSVYGYPTNTDTVYDISLLDNVPIFKKNAKSDTYFVAGYWGLLFPMGWRPSFCPKLSTIQGYKTVGPFKNETDLQIAIKRKG
jgi:hypothetical protein